MTIDDNGLGRDRCAHGARNRPVGVDRRRETAERVCLPVFTSRAGSNSRIFVQQQALGATGRVVTADGGDLCCVTIGNGAIATDKEQHVRVVRRSERGANLSIEVADRGRSHAELQQPRP